MIRLWKFVNLPQVLAVLVLFWLIVDLIIVGRNAGLKASDWAAWVQAIGSIAAILGLVWAARHATTMERIPLKENDRDLAISQLMFLRSALHSINWVMKDLQKCFDTANTSKMEALANNLNPLLRNIEAIAARTSNYDLARIIASLYEPLIFCHTSVSSASMDSQHMAYARMTTEEIVHRITEVFKEFDELSDRLDAPPRPDY